MPLIDNFDQFFADPVSWYQQQKQQQAQDIDQQNKAAIAAPADPTAQNSMLQQMLGTGASALSFAGGTLNKLFGGRAIRAGLSGLTGGPMPWSELASVIPGSDLAGITNESNQVTGRDLLNQWGVTNPKQEGEGFFDPSNLAGMGLDVATDPASYLTFGAGAATKAGQAAEKLGILPKTTAARIAGFTTPEQVAAKLGFKTVPEAEQYVNAAGQSLPDLLNKPLGGLAGLRIPFTTAADSGAILGTGSTAQNVAQQIGRPFQYLANTKPASYLAAQFNPTFKGVVDPVAQNAMLEQAPYIQRAGEGWNRGLADAYQGLVQDLGGELPQEHAQLARAAFEGVPMPGPLQPNVEAAYNQAGQAANALKQKYADEFRAAGGNLGQWESVFDVGHAYRQPTPIDVTSPIFRGNSGRENLARQFYSGVGPAIQREQMFDLPGGTNQLESLIRNPEVGTQARTITPASRPLDWLTSNEPRSQAVEDKLSQAMSGFTPADQQTYTALRDRAASGVPLSSQEQQTMDQLRRNYWQSRRQTVGIVRSDVLGGFNPRDLAALQKQQAAASLTGGALSPADADRLDQLTQLSQASKYAAGKVNRLFAGRTPLPGEYQDASQQILPTLKGALQDRSAENYLRQSLGVDSERLADLTKQAGLSPADVRDFVQSAPEDRRKILMGLASPGENGIGNMVSPTGNILHPDEATELLQQGHLDNIAGPLARYIGQLKPERQSIGLFGNDPFSDLMSYGKGLVQGTGKANIVNTLLARNAIPTGPADTNVGNVATIPTGTILDQLRLNTPQSAGIIGQGMADRGVLGTGVKGLAGDVSKSGVPQDIADAVMQLAPKAKLPEYAAGPLRLFDDATQLTRASITAPWPGFHVRNLTTDMANILQRTGPEGATWGPTAAALARGEAPAELLNLPIVRRAGITDPQEAARLVGREAFANDAFGRGLGQLGGDVMDPASGVLGAIPGQIPRPGFTDVMQGKTLPDNWSLNPLNIQGVGGQTETRFAPAAWGRSMAEQEDTFARGGLFLHALSQDYTPSAAKQMLDATVYGGANFTPFEQQWMRRLMPFWGYQKYVVPQQLQFLAEHPGGLAAQGIRAATAARGTGFLPEYLSGGLAVPLGGEDEQGNQRYLSKLDMPWESPFDLVQPGPNLNAGVANTGMQLLSQLNPLIKSGLEGATNKQFLTGRDLDSLYGGLTGVAAVDNLIYNSPISRAVTSARTLTDPRKYGDIGSALGVPLNLLTGAKVTDVDMEKQRGIAELDALREYLQHDPNAQQHLDFTPKSGQQLSPEEVQVFQLLKTLQAQGQKASQAKKAALAGG